MREGGGEGNSKRKRSNGNIWRKEWNKKGEKTREALKEQIGKGT